MARHARLPALSLPDARSGTTTAVDRGRGPVVLLVVHGASCDGCSRYLRRLADALDRITEWGGRVSVVVPGDAAAADSLAASPATLAADVPTPVTVLADERGAFPDLGALFVADEWGSIYYRADGGPDHALPDPDEVVEWVRFIAIQCPECEGPEGPWREMAP